MRIVLILTIIIGCRFNANSTLSGSSASSNEVIITENEINYTEEKDSVLFEDPDIGSSNGAYRGVDFAAPNTNNVNMYFNNTGSETVYVKLYKESTDKQVGSTLTVTKGKGTHIPIYGIAKTNYYVKITNDLGSRITGHLRLRQFSEQYVVQTTPVSGGSWNTTWEQPEAYKYYKANYVNNANCSATIYVKDKNGNVINKKVSANAEDALYVKNAASGRYTIWIENSNGNIALNGKLTVKSSSVSLKN